MAKPEQMHEQFNPEEIADAQEKLDEFCKCHKFKSIPIKHTGHDDRRWKALVFNMCGLKIIEPKAGRPEDINLRRAALELLLNDMLGLHPDSKQEVTQAELIRYISKYDPITGEVRDNPFKETQLKRKLQAFKDGTKK